MGLKYSFKILYLIARELSCVYFKYLMLFCEVECLKYKGILKAVPRNLTVERRFEGRLRSLKLFAAFIRQPIFTCMILEKIIFFLVLVFSKCGFHFRVSFQHY